MDTALDVTAKGRFFGRRVQRVSAVTAAATTREIVLARGIHKTYDTGAVQTHALRGVDISVERGEMVAIMGPSGCGKTTLLNCLAGLEDFEAGAIDIDGTPLQGMSDNKKTEYRARQMGFVFQSYNLLPVLSAVENVELPLLVSGPSSPSRARRPRDGDDGPVGAQQARGAVGWPAPARDHRPRFRQ